MNSSQIIGMAKADEIPMYYNEKYGIPFYGSSGKVAVFFFNAIRIFYTFSIIYR
jgi:hypothetical protein